MNTPAITATAVIDNGKKPLTERSTAAIAGTSSSFGNRPESDSTLAGCSNVSRPKAIRTTPSDKRPPERMRSRAAIDPWETKSTQENAKTASNTRALRYVWVHDENVDCRKVLQSALNRSKIAETTRVSRSGELTAVRNTAAVRATSISTLYRLKTEVTGITQTNLDMIDSEHSQDGTVSLAHE
jgi:hypothetical protein